MLKKESFEKNSQKWKKQIKHSIRFKMKKRHSAVLRIFSSLLFAIFFPRYTLVYWNILNHNYSHEFIWCFHLKVGHSYMYALALAFCIPHVTLMFVSFMWTKVIHLRFHGFISIAYIFFRDHVSIYQCVKESNWDKYFWCTWCTFTQRLHLTMVNWP